jgi:wobble nucleotide-excising tRNase
MKWEHRFCLNPACSVDFWLVQSVNTLQNSWQITDRFEQGLFTVAANEPVCPRCGTSLYTQSQLAEYNHYHDQQQGPLFDFVRSL